MQEHTVKYQAGTKAYTAEEWTEVISQMEGAVTSYLEAENQCRRNCEKPFDMGWFPEFVVSMSSNTDAGGYFHHNHSTLKCAGFFFSDHFTFCLKCKRKCKARLSNLKDLHDDPHMLAQMYFYLMFAYYKGQYQCEFLFIPEGLEELGLAGILLLLSSFNQGRTSIQRSGMF